MQVATTLNKFCNKYLPFTTKENAEGVELLKSIPNMNRGLLWDNIAEFNEILVSHPDSASHNTDKMQEDFPLEHHFDGDIYTRTVRMPKGSVVVSFIQKKSHPSFLLKGKVSVLLDTGEVETYEAPHSIFTKAGTQRVFAVHEDTVWTCVFNTDKTNVEDVEKEIYATHYRELPQEIINQSELLWLE